MSDETKKRPAHRPTARGEKAVKRNVWMTPTLLAELDREARSRGFSRGELVSRFVESLIGRRGAQARELAVGAIEAT